MNNRENITIISIGVLLLAALGFLLNKELGLRKSRIESRIEEIRRTEAIQAEIDMLKASSKEMVEQNETPLQETYKDNKIRK